MDELHEVVIPPKLYRLLRVISPLLFEKVIKINDHNEVQQRFILITRTWFFMIKKNFLGKYSVRRGFEIVNIQGIVWRECTPQFILKIEPHTAADYRFEGECVNRLIAVLTAIRPEARLWLVDNAIEIYQRQKKKLAEIDVNLIPPTQKLGPGRRDSV